MYRAVFAVLVSIGGGGCGNVKANAPDGGGSGDGGPGGDAPTTGEATLELRIGGTPTAGRHVVFSNPDGTLASEGMTDAGGIATATIATGAMITVSADDHNLMTVAGVKPGDHVVFKNPLPYDDSSAGIVAFGAATEAANKSFYRVDLGTDESVTAVNMTSGTRTLGLQHGNIDGNGKLHVVAGVYDANNALIGYMFIDDVMPVLGQTTTVTLPAYRTDIANIAVMLTGAPADATQLAIDSANERAGFPYMPASFGGLDTATVTNGTASVVVPSLGGFGDHVLTSAHLAFSAQSGSVTWDRRVAPPAGAFAIGATDQPPRLGAAAVDITTATRPKLAWTTVGSKGDGLLVDLRRHNGANVDFAWHVYPPDATAVTFPVASTAIAQQSPNDTSFPSSIDVTLHDLEPMTGFDAFRVALPIDFANPVMPAGFTSWVQSETHATL